MYGKIVLISLLSIKGLCLLYFIQPLKAQEIPFHRGVNITTWFQASNASQIQFSRYTKRDFEQIKSLGCDVIRLPINLHYMTGGAPDYVIEPLFFEFLDEVISWAEELNIQLILDNHTFDVTTSTDPNIGPVLVKVWTQMATRYKDASEYIYYEVLNEPHGISDNLWNNIQQETIDAIRELDTKHYIVIGPAGWNSYNNLNNMPVYADNKLIYTFHFYDPFVFTHQGASWTDPSMVPLSGIPFPYHPDSMPTLPSSLQGTWIESNFNDYPNTGNAAYVRSLLNIAIQFKNNRNVPIFCGEFGVFIPNSTNYSRTYWYSVVRKYLEQNDIAWTTWDYHGGFGLFEENGNGIFEHDLNVPLLDSLELLVPEQTEYVKKADSAGFMIYTDYIGNQIFESSWGVGSLNYYTKDKPNNDKYCISWSGADQYNIIGFDFQPDKDLSRLLNEGYALDFMLRGNSALTSFDVRFMDTKTSDIADHPWRMRFTIDETNTTFNNRWQHVHIPLSSFSEQGSWDDGWFNPEDKFDWTNIDRFEIVAEQENLTGKELWFDNIHVTNLDTAQIYYDSIFTNLKKQQGIIGNIKVYPNPATDYIFISGKENTPYQIKLADDIGYIWLQERFFSFITLDISCFPSGIYFLNVMDCNGTIDFKKIVKY
jgi:endoglucanase